LHLYHWGDIFETVCDDQRFSNELSSGTYAGDAFVAKFDNLGTNLFYLTYLGGSGNDRATAIAVDNSGNAYVAGYTDSPNFPTNNALYKKHQRNVESTSGLLSGGRFCRGNKHQWVSTGLFNLSRRFPRGWCNGIAVDSSNNVYVTGFTYSTNFPSPMRSTIVWREEPIRFWIIWLARIPFTTTPTPSSPKLAPAARIWSIPPISVATILMSVKASSLTAQILSM